MRQTSPTATLVPVEEYLQTSYRPDCEWLNGELRERNMGEQSHVRVQIFFITYFSSRASQLGIRVDAEQRVQVAATRYRVPDVSLMRASDPFEEIVHTAPLLCIEILSRDDTISDMEDRIDDYLHMGVPTIWLIDPRRRTGSIVDRTGSRRTERMTVAETAISIPLAEIFADLDRAQQNA